MAQNLEMLYGDTDAFIVCISANDRRTFNNLAQWHKQLLAYSQPDTPKILVATKKDLKAECRNPVTLEELKAYKKAQEWSGSFETSAIVSNDDGVRSTFMASLKRAIEFKYGNC